MLATLRRPPFPARDLVCGVWVEGVGGWGVVWLCLILQYSRFGIVLVWLKVVGGSVQHFRGVLDSVALVSNSRFVLLQLLLINKLPSYRYTYMYRDKTIVHPVVDNIT